MLCKISHVRKTVKSSMSDIGIEKMRGTDIWEHRIQLSKAASTFNRSDCRIFFLVVWSPVGTGATGRPDDDYGQLTSEPGSLQRYRGEPWRIFF
ncbi:hypothetical protein WA026_020366 [Henosepilachna vigintioctopunctata]|uniref:Uncharacterized protein n=1 Tax=Henosepilachna vigintioctopunctata TaxID=420089 RepID=A0AAW1UQJ7_9CUCU